MKKLLSVFLVLLTLTVLLTACGGGTLESLKSEHGITVEGGGFEEGSVLVTRSVAATDEDGIRVLSALDGESYDRAGKLLIYEIYVTKDGKKIQPEGSVKVTLPLPEGESTDYLLFHVKDDGTFEKLTPVIADQKATLEVSSFSYFVIAEELPAEHQHSLTKVEGSAPGCTAEGVAPHYHCDGCGKNFDETNKEIDSVTLPALSHEYGSKYWGKSANFWEDGNMEYYQCGRCEKYFDEEYKEIESPVIPKFSTNLSICVNGKPTALAIEEQNENFIAWTLEGLSVTKGDVITLCQTDNAEFSHNYFADGNVGTDGKILTTVAEAKVVLTATPNGLMLFIDGNKYEGIVIEINGVQYPMIDTSYPDGIKTYIHGYVNFAAGDKFVIVDNVSGTVYDYDDLDEEYRWDTWDFHRGENGEFVIDYACRYGIEFDYDGNKKIFINKTFAPLDGSSYEVSFENVGKESVELMQMQFETGSEAYKDLMWYYDHEGTVNKEDIVSYIGEKGIYVYIVKLQLEEGTKFTIKNLTANSVINAEHLVEVYTESGSITKEGDYVKILKSGYYSIVYMPCFNGFMIEKAQKSADVLMMLDGEFIYLDKDADGMIYHENFAAEYNTSITFVSGDGLTYYPITLDSEMDSSLLRTYESGGISVVYFTKAGTYNLAYNVETGVLSITSVGGDEEEGGGSGPSAADYLYYLSASGSSTPLTMQVNPANAKELYVKGVALGGNSTVSVIEMSKDGGDYTLYGALYGTDSSIASSYGTIVMVKRAGTYDIYFDTEAKALKLVSVGTSSEEKALPKDIYFSVMKKYTLVENPDNPDELCYLGLEMGAWEDFRIRDTDNNYLADITLASGTSNVATNGSSIAFQIDGIFDIYINKTTHEVRIVAHS